MLSHMFDKPTMQENIRIWRTPLAGGKAHNEIARGVVCSEFAALKGGNQPEPSERRAKTGLYKYTLI